MKIIGCNWRTARSFSHVLIRSKSTRNKKIAEEEVTTVLTDGKVLLQFALASVIEALRRNPDKHNNLLVYNAFSSSTAIICAQESSSQPSYDEDYNAMILEVADKLHYTLLKHMIISITDNATAELKNSSSHSKLPWASIDSINYWPEYILSKA
jgi:hypothetical protein